MVRRLPGPHGTVTRNVHLASWVRFCEMQLRTQLGLTAEEGELPRLLAGVQMHV